MQLTRALRTSFRWRQQPTPHNLMASFSSTVEPERPPVPPFDEASAKRKVQAAEDAWNTRDPIKVSLAYTADSVWRNRSEIFQGRQNIQAFLKRKWEKELDYKLKKYLWCYNGNRIAVRFEYEWHDEKQQWYRSYGVELWDFDERGYMQQRECSINDVPITAAERRVAVDPPTPT